MIDTIGQWLLKSVKVKVKNVTKDRCTVEISGKMMVGGELKKFLVIRYPKITTQEEELKESNISMFWFKELSDFDKNKGETK